MGIWKSLEKLIQNFIAFLTAVTGEHHAKCQHQRDAAARHATIYKTQHRRYYKQRRSDIIKQIRLFHACKVRKRYGLLKS